MPAPALASNLIPADVVAEDTLEDVLSPLKVGEGKPKLQTQPQTQEREQFHAFLAMGTAGKASPPPVIKVTVGEAKKKAANNAASGPNVTKSPTEPSGNEKKQQPKQPSPSKALPQPQGVRKIISIKENQYNKRQGHDARRTVGSVP